MMSVGLVGIGVWPLIAKPAGLTKVNDLQLCFLNFVAKKYTNFRNVAISLATLSS